MIRLSRLALALAFALCAGCFRPQNDLHGQCGSDADCSAGARCDKTQSPPVCVAATCSPPCDSTTSCDLQSVTCRPVTQASIVVTSPVANGFVGSRVQVAATARAPGGATGVTFQVRNAAGALIGTGSGSAPAGSADFAATLSIGGTGLADGGATVTGILTYPGGTLTSASVPVTIDVTPPVVTSLQVFLEGDTIPTAQGVTYPKQPPGATNGFLSGHDGSQFILNDQVRVKGTLTDGGAGLSCASLQYRIDGVDRNAAIVRAPTTQPLAGCTADGTKSVNFDIAAVSINDTTRYGSLGAGTSNLRLVILASDRTTGSANVMADNPILLRVTRLWWTREFTLSVAPGTVSGLAIHPDEDLIVTYNAPGLVETLFALHRDGPFHAPFGEHWKVQAGSILGAPAIGSGTNPPIYVASNSNQSIIAKNADGSSAWSSQTLDLLSNSPAIFQNAKINTITGCEAVLAGVGSSLFAACRDTIDPTQVTFTPLPLPDNILDSPVTVGGGNVFVGTDNSIIQTSFNSSGRLGFLNPVQRFTNGSAGLFTGTLVTSGASVFAASTRDNTTYGNAYLTLPNPRFSPLFTPVLTPAATVGIPIFSSPTTMLFNTADKKLHSMTTAGVDSVFSTLPSSGGTPLLGHDGVAYVGRTNGISAVDSTGIVAWNLSPPASVTALTLDCNGTLYAAAGDTVYAIVTDMASDPNNAGLADTPWPKFQRDSRNTGNADITTKFGVRTAPGPGGCIQ